MAGALRQAESEVGPTDALIYNTDIAAYGPVAEVSEAIFEQSWRVGVLGLYAAARPVGQEMCERGHGPIIVSGATAALRGCNWTTAFAPTKASQRILAQSLTKQFGPKGVHVAYLIIDGVIDTEDTRTGFALGKPDEFFMAPDRIAETLLALVRYDRSAWTFEIDLRPFGEEW